jgi:hypothetical protein
MFVARETRPNPMKSVTLERRVSQINVFSLWFAKHVQILEGFPCSMDLIVLRTIIAKSRIAFSMICLTNA